MATTRSAMKATNTYLKTIAFQRFNVLGFEYEPTLIFDRQIRERVAEKAAAFSKQHKNSKWLYLAYGRSPLTTHLKRETSVLGIPGDDDVGIPRTEWKWRMLNTTFNYMVVSPDPSYLEDLEELLIVADCGRVLEATAFITTENSETGINYTFNVNVERFEVQSFEHLDDHNEGVFSILTMKANVNFPALALNKVYGESGGFAARIILTGYLGGNRDVELFTNTLE